ncbi:MAG: galactofuranosyltransferase [Bacteroidaceae bacterium]|nr:galactofuranosyltransferase [Bacteroidaceae bacterium]
MPRLCYISRNYRSVNSSGNKAKTDNEQTLQALGAKNLGLRTTYYDSNILTFLLDLCGVVKMMFCVKRGDSILLQYPIKKYFAFICRVARMRGAKTTALIHDLGSMRRKKLTVEKEIRRLMHADHVIASNETMKGWLRDHGFTKPLGALGLFDYRSKAERTTWPEQHERPILVYASALAMRKNSFLLNMAPIITNYDLHVYGNRGGLPDLVDTDHLKLFNFMAAEDFIDHVDGDFGLVWDGDSLDTCSGAFGEYLRWNSPHKVSFCLRAGQPVIIWREAAVAPIIEELGIGLCIDSLRELNDLLQKITPEQMQTMRRNVKAVSDRLKDGQFLKKAMQAIDQSVA